LAGGFTATSKPANIMLDAKSRVKVLDFGLATLAGAIARLEKPRKLLSLAPPRKTARWHRSLYVSGKLRGEPTDARSDFSPSVSSLRMLVRQLPFRGETSIDISHAILRQPHASLRILLPDISPEWSSSLTVAWLKSAEQRCVSMEEVLDTLFRITAPASGRRNPCGVYFANLSGDRETNIPRWHDRKTSSRS